MAKLQVQEYSQWFLCARDVYTTLALYSIITLGHARRRAKWVPPSSPYSYICVSLLFYHIARRCVYHLCCIAAHASTIFILRWLFAHYFENIVSCHLPNRDSVRERMEKTKTPLRVAGKAVERKTIATVRKMYYTWQYKIGSEIGNIECLEVLKLRAANVNEWQLQK